MLELMIASVSVKRLEQLAHKASKIATGRRIRLVAQLLLAGGLLFVLLRLQSTWHDSHIGTTHIDWGWLAGATSLAGGVVLISAFLWLEILRRLGAAPRPGWARVFLQAQLGKYIPGGLWQYAGRGALAQSCGLPLRLVARSLPVEVIASTCAAVPFSLLLFGWWGALGLVVAFGLAAFAGSIRNQRVTLRIAAKMTLLYAAVWPLIGATFWMTARALVNTSVGDAAVYTGAFAVAWIGGLFAIYAPGGLGVREAVLVAVLHNRIGSSEALLVAVVSRGVFTLADVGAAIVSSVSLNLRCRKKSKK